MTIPAIRTEGLTKDYGHGHGIFDLDLEIRAGETFGFIGPNGAGKSTTIRLLMDFIRATRGHAELLGLDSRRDSLAVKRLVGFIPGELPEFPNHRGIEILELFANLRGGVEPRRIEELAQRLELDIRRKYREYSHGNKQKLMLVQAFMHGPRLLILDEPTLGLDPVIQQVFRSLLREAASGGATVFLSSHVLSEVQEICDRVGIVADGRLRTVGTLEELRELHVHRVDAHLERAVDPARIAGIAGVSDVRITDHHVLLRMQGNFEPLLDALVPSGIVEIDSEEMSLEEVFLAHYAQSSSSL